MTALARAVLRSAVGDGNYARLETICEALTLLEMRAVISREGADSVLESLAEALTSRAAAREGALQDCPTGADTWSP